MGPTLADLVYRAISRTSYERRRPWPLLAIPVSAQRWNIASQPTIYASPEPHVAAAEKLGRLASSVTLASARSYWGATPVTNEVLVLSFDPAIFRPPPLGRCGRNARP